MDKVTGFLEYERKTEQKKSVNLRIKNYSEFTTPLSEHELKCQSARCMNCGIPFCHSGCPLGNLIPDFNDAVYQENWSLASHLLHMTNNFPEFTGRLCPAPCEEACVLNINQSPVAIENIEKSIAEHAFEMGLVQAVRPQQRTGKQIAVIGSGPAGLAAAEQLNKAGHHVVVFEKDNKPGGLLRYGIPDFKLEKHVIDRRLSLLMESGVKFKCNTEVVSKDDIQSLTTCYDAIALCVGANQYRVAAIEEPQGGGVYQAIDFLKHNNQVVAGELPPHEKLQAKNKHVVVLGGGDTGSDCIGTANRQGALSVTNFEIMNKPPRHRQPNQPWPFWPMRLRVSTSHEEGVSQRWNVLAKAFICDDDGQLKAIKTVNINWTSESGTWQMHELEGTEKEWQCDMVLLALGFTGTQQKFADAMSLRLNDQSVFTSDDGYKISEGVFAAGDCRRGQSLIVWAISEGREMAHHIDKYLMGSSKLPLKGDGDLPQI